MSDFVALKKGGNIGASFMHILLNLAFAGFSIVITLITGSPVFGIILVFLSKWRIFAVRPKYWFPNLKSNLVDIIVGVSFVLIAYYIGMELSSLHFIIATLYAVWLIIIKPSSRETMTELQSLAAVFLGFTAAGMGSALLSTISAGTSFFDIELIYLILVSFIIGYGAIRHILVQSDDFNFNLVILFWGLITAEISWILYHFSIIYFIGEIHIPQIAFLQTVSTFLFIRIYKSILKRGGRFSFNDIIVPLIFSALFILIMLVWFSIPRLNY